MSSIITPDYYEILELDRKASQEDIKEAYRNLSLRFNPKKASRSNETFYNYKFHKIAEAYIVLSDPYKKGLYDNHGRDALYKESLMKMEIFLEVLNTRVMPMKFSKNI